MLDNTNFMTLFYETVTTDGFDSETFIKKCKITKTTYINLVRMKVFPTYDEYVLISSYINFAFKNKESYKNQKMRFDMYKMCSNQISRIGLKHILIIIISVLSILLSIILIIFSRWL